MCKCKLIQIIYTIVLLTNNIIYIVNIMLAIVLLILTISAPISGLKIGLQDQLQQRQEVMPIFLSETKFVDTELDDLSSFYSLSLANISFGDQDTLVISAVSEQRTFISIYINVVEESQNANDNVELPSAENAQIKCSDLNVVACVLLKPQPNSIIYMSVATRDPISYVLYTDIKTIQTLQFQSNSSSSGTSVKLNQQFAQVFAFDFSAANAETDQIIVKAQYDQSENQGDYQLFTMRAGSITQNGTSIAQSLSSHSLGAYAQAINLLKKDESYIMVITGQMGLSLTIQLIVPSSTLSMNSPTQYLYDANLQSSITQIRQFWMDTQAYIQSIGEDDVSFAVFLQKLNGQGDITVSVCDFSYTFKGDYGQTSFVIIPDPALTCEKPDLKVKISNVAWIFGLRITVQPYNSFSTMDQTLYLNEERVQDIDSFQNPCLDFEIEPLDAMNIDTQQNMTLIYFGNPENKKITFKTCDLNGDYEQINCKSTQLSVKDSVSQHFYQQNSSQDSSLKICTQSNQTDNYFSLLVMPYPLVKTINIDNKIMDVVSNGQTILYAVNTSKPKSVNTTLEVRVTLFNGDIYLYDNCSANRVIDQSNQGNQNKFCALNNEEQMWNLSASYNLSQIDPKDILFGIQGSAESLIQVVAYLDYHLPTPDPIPPEPTPEPEPNPTLTNLTDGVNKIALIANVSSVYAYDSHIIPYNISLPGSIMNSNYCVEVFQSLSELQSKPVCSGNSSVPKQSGQYLWDIVYFRISQVSSTENPPQNLSINVSVPKITIQKGQSIYLSCNQYCYSDIKLKTDGLSKNVYVTINGPGYINSTPSTQQSSLTFSSSQILPQFTATLPEGGNLYIQINDEMPMVASWNNTEIDMSQDYSLFIVPIGTYSSYETLLVNSFGTPFSISKKLFMLNTSQSNIVKYEYASDDNEDAKFYSSPKFNTPTVPLILPTSNSSAQQIPKECFESFYYKCFLAVTLVVRERGFIVVDYDNFHITTNSLVQYLSLNTFDVITSTFGVTYFSTLNLKNTRQGYNQNSADWDAYQIANDKVNVRPLSSCGTLQADLIRHKFSNSQQMDDETVPSYLSILSTDSCVYSVGVSSCPISLIQSGALQMLEFSKDTYSGLYSSLSGSNSYSIGVWKNQSVEENEDESYYPQLIVSVYLLNDQQNCSAANGVLQTTYKLGLNQELDIYQTSSKQSLVSIPVADSNDGKLFLIQIQAVNSGNTPLSTIKLNMQISSEQANSILLPNRDPIPILSKPSSSQSTQTFNYYTNLNQWQLCFETTASSDIAASFNISVFIQDTVLSSSSISHQESGKCLNISNGKKKTYGEMTVYKVVVIASYGSGSSQGASTLWIWTKQSVQSIPLSESTLIYDDPEQVLSISTNGKFGKCYSHNIAVKGQQITMIVYLNQSSVPGAMTNLSIPNSDTKANITSVLGSKHGNVVGYRVLVTAHKMNQAVDVCINTNQPYYLTIAEESQQFNLILQDQTLYKHTGKILGQLKSLQIYKFLQMHAPKRQKQSGRLLQQSNDSVYLITELVQCTGNISNFSLLGSTSIPGIIFTDDQQFDKTFSKYNVMAGITEIEHGDEFYIGVKYDGNDNANYSLRTYTVNSSQIPQAKWSLSSAKILKSQFKGDDFITVQLPIVNSSTKAASSHSSVKYTVYVVDYPSNTNNQSEVMIKCPGLQQLKNSIKIYNVTLQNPTIPLFKLKLTDLPSRNISIYASATVRESADTIPFTYFYQSDSMEVQANEQGHDGKNINLILIFILLGVAIFLVLLFRFITKVIKKRKQRASLSFQLSPAQNVHPNPQPTQPADTQNANYGEFVQETA